MRTKTLGLLVVLSLFLLFSQPAKTETSLSGNSEAAAQADKVFKARVVRIVEERVVSREDGSRTTQQNLLLQGLEGEWEGMELAYNGISDIDVASNNYYKPGDKVFLSEVSGVGETAEYYINDLVRTGPLLWLTILFSVVIVAIGKKKGLKSLISLVISFFVIIKFIVPQIINGASPLIVGVFGTLFILAIIIYITEGWGVKSHISVASVFISLVITFTLSYLFTSLTRLTGLAQEETVFLLGTNGGSINFQGLLLAGILIGAIGVLDDVIVGQVESVRQIKIANPSLTNKQVFKAAYEVGNTHLSAIVNTLFLTYAGASLPLLLLFYINPTGPVSFSQVINSELVATEIIRTLVGSIGVALSMPIATLLACIGIKSK